MKAAVNVPADEEYSHNPRPRFDGERARDFAAHLTRFNRPLGSQGYDAAAQWVAEQLRCFDLDSVAVERFPGDGKTRVFTWMLPPSWNPRSATLRMVEPREQALAKFPDVPSCLMINSVATPPGGVLAELIDMGEGTRRSDYDGRDARGKMVLGSGNTNVLSELAIGEMGAAGIVSDYMVETEGYRERQRFPDQICHGTLRSFAAAGDYKGFGFSVSYRQAEALRGLLRERRVVLRAEVDARLGEQEFSVVAGRIIGSNPEAELLVITHLCHPAPGANDNASGVGAAMELARVLACRKREEDLRTSVRFLFVPEFFGTLAYVARHRGDLASVRAGLCLDQVGANQEKCGSTLFLEHPPDCTPHIIGLLCEQILEEEARPFPGRLHGTVGKFRWQASPYTGGSDHYPLNDPTIGIPTVLFLNWPDFFYHSDQDTADKLDPEMLALVGRTAERAICALNPLGHDAAVKLLNRVVSDTVQQVAGMVEPPAGTENAAKIRLEFLLERAAASVESMKPFLEPGGREEFERKSDAALAYLRRASGEIRSAQTPAIPANGSTTMLDWAPRRTFCGPLYRTELLRRLAPGEKSWWKNWAATIPSFPLFFDLLIFHCDGRRSLNEILSIVAMQCGTAAVPEGVARSLDLLARKGFLEWARKGAPE